MTSQFKTTPISDRKIGQLTTYIQKYVSENGFPPSFREICIELNIKSTATVYYYFQKMEERGIIKRHKDKNRCIELLPPYNIFDHSENDSIPVPLVGNIAAGIPITAVENVEETFNLPKNFFKLKANETFMLKVKGESMIEAGILNGDYVIIRKQATASNGEIVAAMINDEVTLKRYFLEKDCIRLKPENSTMSDIIIQTDIVILGIAIGLIRNSL